MTATDPAVPNTVKPPLELHRDPEPEWISIKEAAELIADGGETLKQVERRVRFWATNDKINAKRDGTAPNAAILVIGSEVEAAEANRPDKKRQVETLPAINEIVFSELRDMGNRLIDAETRAAKAETVAEFKSEMVKDLKEQLEVERAKPVFVAKRGLFRRR